MDSEVEMTHHGTVRSRLREFRLAVALVALGAVGAVTVGIITSGGGLAFAGIADEPDNGDPPVVSCPEVGPQLPDLPEAAAAEVRGDLAALQAQIAAANQRLETSQGEGGPDFVQNAILGPLADKRTATLERIEIAIGRHAERPALQGLAECALADGTGAANPGQPPDSEQPGAQQQDGQQPDGQQLDGGDSDGAADGEDQAGTPVGAPTVDCPIVVDALPRIPDAAVDEVLRELDALQSQIAAANQRLETSQGEGGPDFVQNAVLGPLADKRTATLERIEIAIGRHAERPALQGLAECGLNESTGP